MIRHSRIIMALAGWMLFAGAGLFSQSPGIRNELLVSTGWLEENLADSLLVILHYGMRTAFDKEHIPGARYVDIGEFMVEDEQGLRNELPVQDSIEQALRTLGINNNSIIIISYEDVNAIPRATRVYFTLDYAGLADRVSILDGGLKAWKQEGRPLTDTQTEFETGDVDVLINEEVRVQKKEVLENLHKEGVVIVDARPAERYYGAETDSNSSRQGHIEGAVSIPYFKLYTEGDSPLFRPEEELRSLFEEYGIWEGTTVISYCGSGIWASPVYFAARYLGYKVRLYDGSMQEWGNDNSLPMSGPDSGAPSTK